MRRIQTGQVAGINGVFARARSSRKAGIVAAAALSIASAAMAQTKLYLDANGASAGLGSGTAIWDASTTADWNTSSAGTGASGTWVQPGQTAGVDDFNLANFNGSAALTANVVGTVDVGGISFNAVAGNQIQGTGTLNFGTDNVTIANNVNNTGQNILVPITGSGTMTIAYAGTGGQGQDMNILGDLTSFTGTVVVATDSQGSVGHLNYTQLAIGSDLGSGATIQLDSYSQLTTENPTKNNVTGLDQQPTFTLNAPITLNATNAANAQEWIGAANGGNYGSQYPSTAMQSIMALNGVISGNAGTLFFGYGNNGGRGTVVLNNNETYTGNTYIDLASNNGLVQMGVDNALPAATVLSFGPNTANGASTSAVAPLDLNGHVMTIAGLATTSTYTNSSANTQAAAQTSQIGNIYNTSGNAASIVITGSANTTYKGDIGDANINVNPFNSMYPYKGVATANTNISLTINGPGVLTLAPQVTAPTATLPNYMADEYTGNTTVNGGGLTFGRANVFGGLGTTPPAYYTLVGGGTVTVNSGATLSSSATTFNGANSTVVGGAQGNIVLNSGSHFTPGGAGTTGAFVTQSMDFDGGADMSFDIASPTNYDWMVVYGALTLDAAPNHTVNINVPNGDTLIPGTYNLIYTGGGINLGGDDFVLGATPNNGDTFNLIDNGSQLQVQIFGPLLQWDPSGQGPTSANATINEGQGEWTDGSGTDGAPATTFYNYANDTETTWSNSATSDVLIGGDATQSGGQIHLGSNIVVNGEMIFGPIASGANYSIVNINGNTYTLTLGGGIAVNNTASASGSASAEIDVPVILSTSQTWEVDPSQKLVVTGSVTENDGTPSYTLTKTGTGELDLNGANGSIGSLSINAGAVVLGDMTAIGNAPVAVNGAALEFGVSGTFTNAVSGGTSGLGIGGASATTVTVTQDITSAGPVELVDNGTLIFSGNISGTSLANDTLGTTTFNGSAAFTGNITNLLTGGRVYFNGNTSANIITISGGTTLLAEGATDNFANGINITANTLVVGSTSDVGVTAGNPSGNAINFTPAAATGGTLNLGGTTTQPNGITVLPNNINLGGTSAEQDGSTITTYSFVLPGGTSTSAPITLSGVISGDGNLTLLGTDYTLSGANTFGPPGGLGAGGGQLTLGNSGSVPQIIHAANATSFGTGAIDINAGGVTLDIQTNVMANAIHGGSIVTKTGAGTLVLSGKTSTGPSNGLGYIIQQGAIELQSIYGLGGGTVSTGATSQGTVTIDPGASLLADVGGTENLGTITLAGGTIARIADAANTADFNLSTYYTDTSGATQTHSAVINVTASSTFDNQDQATAGNSRNLIVNEPINVGSGAALTIQSENSAGNYEQAAVVLRGTSLTLSAGSSVVDSGTGDVDLGDAATGEPIVAQGAPGSDVLMQLGSHTFLNDGGTTLTINGSGNAGLRIEAPMVANYTVPNSAGAPSLRSYDGTTGLTGTNTTGTASAGTTPTGYTTIGNGFTVLTPSRLGGLSTSTGTLTIAATDAAGATGLINAGPTSPSAVALALDNTAQSGGTLVYQIDGGGATPTFKNFAGLTVERTNSSAAAVTAQLANHTMLTPSLTINGGAVLDIGSEAMAIDTTGAPELSQIAGYLQTGYDKGNWDGLGGIDSSSIALQQGTSVGYALNSSLPTPFSIFGGQAVDDDAILVKYTWLGDLNLDGVVDSADYNMMGKLGTVNPGWIGGDLNYDGVLNADDWSLFDLGAAAQTGPLTTSVPEPSALGLLAGAGWAMRRRRKVKADAR